MGRSSAAARALRRVRGRAAAGAHRPGGGGAFDAAEVACVWWCLTRCGHCETFCAPFAVTQPDRSDPRGNRDPGTTAAAQRVRGRPLIFMQRVDRFPQILQVASKSRSNRTRRLAIRGGGGGKDIFSLLIGRKDELAPRKLSIVDRMPTATTTTSRAELTHREKRRRKYSTSSNSIAHCQESVGRVSERAGPE
jgi:hypothetical protein